MRFDAQPNKPLSIRLRFWQKDSKAGPNLKPKNSAAFYGWVAYLDGRSHHAR